MNNTLLSAGVFGAVTGFTVQFGQQIYNNPLYRNYAIMGIVFAILAWIVFLNGHKRLI